MHTRVESTHTEMTVTFLSLMVVCVFYCAHLMTVTTHWDDSYLFVFNGAVFIILLCTPESRESKITVAFFSLMAFLVCVVVVHI